MSKQPKPRERPELLMGHAAFYPYPNRQAADEILRIVRAQKAHEKLRAAMKRVALRKRKKLG